MSQAAPKSWDNDLWALIRWFKDQKALPMGPYTLREGVTILNAELFYQRLREDIECGPRGTRAIMGSLKTDLTDLKAVIDNGQWP